MTTIFEVVQQLCLGYPESDETSSHGFPNFRVAGKTFATYSLNHHGDDKVALLLNMGNDTQAMLVDSAPDIFFVPPYSGTKGWVGVELNKGLSWKRVSQLTFDAWARTAPARLARDAVPVTVKPPTEMMSPEDINPIKSATNQALLTKLTDLCMALPEVEAAKQFGDPAFKAGKKTFCVMGCRGQDSTYIQFWIGAERQLSLSSMDKRFKVPPYIGHRGWINLTISHKANWKEIRELVIISYEHFALKRMLTKLDQANSAS